jgi:hypothetical protein
MSHVHKKQFTVFVCSTYADLENERRAILDAIRRLQLKHDSMEFFGARTQRPLETCLKEVRGSDIMVVVIGHRYGSFVPGSKISYSEAEYEEGRRLNKPCLVYVRDENVPVLPKHMEKDFEKIALLDRWKERLTKSHTIASYQDENKLAVQVAADLGRTIRDWEVVVHAESRIRTEVASSPPASAVVRNWRFRIRWVVLLLAFLSCVFLGYRWWALRERNLGPQRTVISRVDAKVISGVNVFDVPSLPANMTTVFRLSHDGSDALGASSLVMQVDSATLTLQCAGSSDTLTLSATLFADGWEFEIPPFGKKTDCAMHGLYSGRFQEASLRDLIRRLMLSDSFVAFLSRWAQGMPPSSMTNPLGLGQSAWPQVSILTAGTASRLNDLAPENIRMSQLQPFLTEQVSQEVMLLQSAIDGGISTGPRSDDESRRIQRIGAILFDFIKLHPVVGDRFRRLSVK